MTAEEYLRSVDLRLRDLPWRTRRELVSELRAHLMELPTDTDLGARLGPPEQYAAELRAAAGLERRRGPVAFLRARRPRNVALAVVALIVTGLAIPTVEWVDSYQPLVWSGSVVAARAIDAEKSKAFRRLLPQFHSHTGALVVGFHEGHPFRFGMTIGNRGRFAVRILGVSEPVVPFSARLLVSEPLDRTAKALEHARLQPFRPFDLHPGQERLLVLRGVYDAHFCRTGLYGAGGMFVPFPVRFSFLWKTATVHMTTSTPQPPGLFILIPRGTCRTTQ